MDKTEADVWQRVWQDMKKEIERQKVLKANGTLYGPAPSVSTTSLVPWYAQTTNLKG